MRNSVTHCILRYTVVYSGSGYHTPIPSGDEFSHDVFVVCGGLDVDSPVDNSDMGVGKEDEGVDSGDMGVDIGVGNGVDDAAWTMQVLLPLLQQQGYSCVLPQKDLKAGEREYTMENFWVKLHM